MLRTRRALTTAATALLAAALGCEAPTGTAYLRPADTGDGWATATLADAGMDAAPLLELRALVDSTPDHLIHGVVIARHGKLVYEAYWPGTDLEPGSLEPVERDFDRETLHYVASVSKSMTSALVGIAVDRGLIGGVDDLLFSYFPEYVGLSSEASRRITLEHLLAFSSGYDWNEHVYGFDDPRDSHVQMFGNQDPVAYLLSRPVLTEPGTTFRYNSGDTNLLGEIVRRVAGAETLVAYAEQVLFRPLEIDVYEWLRLGLAPEVTFASGGASLRPRDMAKLGQLYLDGGVWDGRRIVPAAWVEASTAVVTPLPGYQTVYGYGYNWWLGRSDLGAGQVEHFRAAGWGGQDVFVFRELDLVVVFTAGGYYDERPLSVHDLLEGYILSAITE